MEYSKDGILFRFEGKMLGLEMLPKELLGSREGGTRFWISYLRVGELFCWKDAWYKVEVNKLVESGSLQSYTFYASSEKIIVREE